MGDIPLYSKWRHRNGNVYVVMAITNLPDDERYPKTIVYRNIENATWWSRRYDDWLRSFTPCGEASDV